MTKVLLVGVGGVGEAIAVVAKDRPWLTEMVLADYNLARAEEVQAKLGDPAEFPVERIDASDRAQIVALARKHGVDLVMNAVDPIFNEAIFDAALDAGVTYMDMAMTLSKRDPSDPYRKSAVKLGDYQFERSPVWEEKGLLALVGMGVEPGMSDVFAKHAAKHLFDEIDEIGVRDGANLIVEGYDFAPNFSIWTTIEECLNPPVIWEKERGWFTTDTFSEPEVFEFPEGIGPVECVNVEHEEVVLKVIELLNLDKTAKVKVKGVEVSPRDVVAACLPDPAHLGDRMHGKTCAGTWVRGTKDGKPREVYVYQIADNQHCMDRYGVQAVVWQTAVNPVIAMELLATGAWKGTGVLGPEAFDPDPFIQLMPEFDFPMKVEERTPTA